MALERHATSKLDSSDLAKINFLGFRGEALPSIASISDFLIGSIKKGNQSGWELRSFFGKLGSVRPSRLRQGTSIEVNDLLDNSTERIENNLTDLGFKKLNFKNKRNFNQIWNR